MYMRIGWRCGSVVRALTTDVGTAFTRDFSTTLSVHAAVNRYPTLFRAR